MSKCELYHGDCLELMKSIPDGSVDAVITDAPYNISKKSTIDRSKFSSIKMKREKGVNLDFGSWDMFSRSDFEKFTLDWMKECARILRDGGTLISFFDIANISLLTWIGNTVGIKTRNIFTWHKSNPVPSIHKVNYRSSCELAFMGSKGDKRWTFNFDRQETMHNFFETPNKSIYGETDHPTEKPVTLMTHLVNVHTKNDDIVVDPFMGSGTTGVACVKSNRNFIGIEKDNKYFDVAKSRIAKAESTPQQGMLAI